MFIIGRILCGLSCGLGSHVTPTYVGEISTIKARGSMGTGNQLFIVIGILLASVIGHPLAKVSLWRINYAIVAVPAILQFFLMAGCVESPRYLISINRIEEARESLQRLRPNSSIDHEFYAMVEGQLGSAAARAISGDSASGHIKDKDSFDADMMEDGDFEDEGQREPMNMIEIFHGPLIRRIAVTVLMLHVLMNAVMYYSTIIFNMAFNPSMSKDMAIITTVVNVISTFISLFLIDRIMGRRPLLLIAETGVMIFSVLLIIGYVYNLGALLVVSVFDYVLAFTIGVGPIPWMMTSELTPVYASSAVGAIATAMNWAMNFLIALLFPIVFSTFAICFTWFKAPETKGRSLEDIVESFKNS